MEQVEGNKVPSLEQIDGFSVYKVDTVNCPQRACITPNIIKSFYSVVFTIEGKGTHILDKKNYPIADKQIFFVAPDREYTVSKDSDGRGYRLFFSQEYLLKRNIPLDIITDINLFKETDEYEPIVLAEGDYSKLLHYIEELYLMQHSNELLTKYSLSSLLILFLIECSGVNSKVNNPKPASTAVPILREFKALVNQHYKQWHGTTRYAEALNITPDYLNRIVKSQTNKTAKEYIQNRIISAAKRLLDFTDLSNKQIGYQLGFSQPANFSAFFKKNVGVSPSEFRSNT